jgi:hypothetical protein
MKGAWAASPARASTWPVRRGPSSARKGWQRILPPTSLRVHQLLDRCCAPSLQCSPRSSKRGNPSAPSRLSLPRFLSLSPLFLFLFLRVLLLLSPSPPLLSVYLSSLPLFSFLLPSFPPPSCSPSHPPSLYPPLNFLSVSPSPPPSLPPSLPHSLPLLVSDSLFLFSPHFRCSMAEPSEVTNLKKIKELEASPQKRVLVCSVYIAHTPLTDTAHFHTGTPGSRQSHLGPAIRRNRHLQGSADPAPGSVSGNTHTHTVLFRALSLSLSLPPSLPPSLSLSLPCFSLSRSLSHFSF